MKITQIIKNFSKFNIVGQLVDWGTQPGRVVSLSYICDNGYVAVQNRRDPHQFTFDFYKDGKNVTQQFRSERLSIDWSTKKDALKSNRCIDGLKSS
jgi:hypothetical protein